MRRGIFALCLLCACEAGGFSASQQSPSALRGRVVGADGRAAPGVTVYLVPAPVVPGVTPTAALLTDEAGFFERAPIAAGSLLLVATDGALGAALEVHIRPGDNTIPDLVLAPLDRQLELLDVHGVGFEERISRFGRRFTLDRFDPDGPSMIVEFEEKSSAFGSEVLPTEARFYRFDPTVAQPIAPLPQLTIEGRFMHHLVNDQIYLKEFDDWLMAIGEPLPEQDGVRCHYYDAARGRPLRTQERAQEQCLTGAIYVTDRDVAIAGFQGVVEKVDRQSGQVTLYELAAPADHQNVWVFPQVAYEPVRAPLGFYRTSSVGSARADLHTLDLQTLETAPLGRFEEPTEAWSTPDRSASFVIERRWDGERLGARLLVVPSGGAAEELVRIDDAQDFSTVGRSWDGWRVYLMVRPGGLHVLDMRERSFSPQPLPGDEAGLMEQICGPTDAPRGFCTLEALGEGVLRYRLWLLEPQRQQFLADVRDGRLERLIQVPAYSEAVFAPAPIVLHGGRSELMTIVDPRTGLLHLGLGPRGAPLEAFSPLTHVGRDHRLLGISSGERYVYYTMDDPVLGGAQIFRRALPEAP